MTWLLLLHILPVEYQYGNGIEFWFPSHQAQNVEYLGFIVFSIEYDVLMCTA